MKAVRNGQENTLTIAATVYFCREQEREWERWKGKRIQYYGISGTDHVDREYVNYNRESGT
jgi:hypothetical protein